MEMNSPTMAPPQSATVSKVAEVTPVKSRPGAAENPSPAHILESTLYAAKGQPGTLDETDSAIPNPQNGGSIASSVTVRPMKLSEVSTCAELLSKAFWDEDAVGRFFHPHKHKYPSHVTHYWKRFLYPDWIRWRQVVKVAVNDKGIIKGVGVWLRKGSKAKGSGWRYSFRGPIEVLTKAALKVDEKIKPNRASEPERLAAYGRSMHLFAHHWEGERAECWELQTLGVDPESQGQGIGRLLVLDGLKLAEQDNLSTGLVSAAGKESFYLKLGFTEVVGNVTHGVGNEMADIKGGDIMFTPMPQNPGSAAKTSKNEITSEEKTSN